MPRAYDLSAFYLARHKLVLLGLIRKHGGNSRSSIMRKTRGNYQTVKQAMDELLEDGLLEERLMGRCKWLCLTSEGKRVHEEWLSIGGLLRVRLIS